MSALGQIDAAVSPVAGLSFQHTLAGSGTVAAIGDDVLVIAGLGGTDALTSANITDSQGQTWTLDAQANDGSHRIGVWRARLTANLTGGSDWIKFATSSSVWRSLRILRLQGGGSNPDIDQEAASSGQPSGTSVTTGTTPATTQAAEYVIACYIANGAVSFAAFPAGFTQLGAALSPNSVYTEATAYEQVVVTGTQTGNSATISPAAAKGGFVATYKLAAATGFVPRALLFG